MSENGSDNGSDKGSQEGSQKGSVKEEEPPVFLKPEMIKAGLSQLQRIPDGNSFGFATLAIEE